MKSLGSYVVSNCMKSVLMLSNSISSCVPPFDTYSVAGPPSTSGMLAENKQFSYLKHSLKGSSLVSG
ncbi:hypothetical protein JVT61DRAFT_13708 [Boletus reticuloceps]|uniref:Uncharacterized protein n=1 Tax=Boletus reticuloceps TaxID=495285 RepID=A0A8I2YU31_9AGAM|nr:hypothetical protein JVT61DRAFT_13708 [Boletus reticuloceps]